MKKNFLLIFLFCLLPLFTLAFSIEEIPHLETKGDFLLGPGKTEIWLNPGEKATREVSVTNRLGKKTNFKVEVQDFIGSRDSKEIILWTEEETPYSLKNFLKPEIEEFTLSHGQKITIPVEISIPSEASPGGYYGAVIISALPEKKEGEGKPQVEIIPRLANLFFVRVKGEVKEDGFLKDFKTKKKFYEKGPIDFEIYFENNGNIHLMPYGLIEIKNLLGKKLGEIEIGPFFALPQSLRLREVSWQRGFLLGKYNAILSLNRGYKDIIDQKSIDFFVIPWKIILAVFVVLAILIWIFKWTISHFEIRKKI
jgi:hypothetical protein